MRSLILTFLYLFAANLALGQGESKFNVVNRLLTDSVSLAQLTAKQISSSHFFEDEYYTVRKTCSGEWGGTVWFKNKKTGKEYSCSAGCPVALNKINGKYVVSSSMDHMRGSCEIVVIKDPRSMAIFKLPKPEGYINGKPLRSVDQFESTSKKGTKMLLDQVGTLILTSFIYRGELYHIIVTEERTTALAKIENKKLTIVRSILDKPLWPDDADVTKTVDGHTVVLVHTREKHSGVIDIFENNITMAKRY